MQKITLKLQDLQTGVTRFEELDDEAATIAFLKERPRFTDVLGVVFEGLSREQNARLKSAMRPLDEDEKKAEDALLAKAKEAADKAQAARQAEEEAALIAHRNSLKTADPNRILELRYRFDGGISIVDPAEPRELTEDVRNAVMEWVAERNEWVESRGQVVGEAKISVWPGVVPKDGTSRIFAGSFVPVTGPAKKET